MNTTSNPKSSTSKTKTPTTQPSKPESDQLTLKTPKLLFPTLACLLATAATYILTYKSYLIHSLPIQLTDMLHALLLPLLPALGLFLLHRLLEVIIIHRAFRPAHLLSVLALVLSVAVFAITGLAYFWIILYVLAAIIFGASLAFQKSHSLATDPAHFRSSLLSAAIASFILSLINLIVIALTAFELINQYLENILFSIAVIVTIPLQLALIFLCLAKLSTLKSAKSPSTSTPASTPHSATPPAKSSTLLSRFDRFILGAAFALAIISTTAYLAFIEQMFAEEYSHRQPCCMQPTYYED